MTTFLDRWFRAPKLQKYSGAHQFELEVVVNFTPKEKRLVTVFWNYDGQSNYASVDKVVCKNSSVDIWHDLPGSTCGAIKGHMTECYVRKWMDEVGIVHPYNHEVLRNPYSGKW